ncbi:alpha/beta fold hydrolase [Isoptericola sp. NPDC057653]|uniref:alpha/beta fold hydrolase n=1 Tax=Isoptericola sp. NPDC057653 TaxID=3346195 RepID=UPI0036C5DD62
MADTDRTAPPTTAGTSAASAASPWAREPAAGRVLLDRRFVWEGREVAWAAFGSGPPLVFCHGTPWSSWLWEPYARALAAEFTVHLWDMPGYGASSKDPDHAVDLGVQGEVLAALLEHWRPSWAAPEGAPEDRPEDGPGAGSGGGVAPHVVAHDYGGAVSLRAALLHGARFASLCLVDVVALRPWGSPYFSLVREHADVFTRTPATVHRGALEAYVRTAAHRPLSDADLDALATPWTGPEGQAAFYRQIAQADERYTAELEPLLGALDVPTRVLWGAEDTWIPADRAQRLADALPRADARLVPGAGHLVQLDAPVALAVELQRWLSARAGDAATE